MSKEIKIDGNYNEDEEIRMEEEIKKTKKKIKKGVIISLIIFIIVIFILFSKGSKLLEIMGM